MKSFRKKISSPRKAIAQDAAALSLKAFPQAGEKELCQILWRFVQQSVDLHPARTRYYGSISPRSRQLLLSDVIREIRVKRENARIAAARFGKQR